MNWSNYVALMAISSAKILRYLLDRKILNFEDFFSHSNMMLSCFMVRRCLVRSLKHSQIF